MDTALHFFKRACLAQVYRAPGNTIVENGLQTAGEFLS
jgi:hypothetical protein